MSLETFNLGETDHLVWDAVPGEAPPPYEPRQTDQESSEAVEVATQPNAETNPPHSIVPAALTDFFFRCDMKKYKQLGHTSVAVLLFITTVTVMLAANDMAVHEKVTLYETMSMNSVAFMMIYLTTRLSSKPTTTYYNFNRMAEFVGIGISIFLFLISLLMYTDIVSIPSTDYKLILGIICLVSAFGIEIVVLILLICLFCLE